MVSHCGLDINKYDKVVETGKELAEERVDDTEAHPKVIERILDKASSGLMT